jgi:hypothetical protein
MQKDIIIVENFYKEPFKIREYALNEIKNNSYEVYPQCAPRWRTSSFKEYTDCQFKASLDLIKKLEFICNEEIDLDNWNATYPCDRNGNPTISHNELLNGCENGKFSSKWNCSFHFKFPGKQELGDGIHTHSSNDDWSNVGDDGWSGLIYLNPNAPINTGLNLWQNKFGNNYRWMTDKSEWILEDSIGAIFNRLILIRGKKPHSGIDGFDTNIDSGRLFQTFFFRTKNSKIDPVKINL